MANGSRRLAAVMLTDIVGYTALTQHDEANALRLLEEHRQIVRPLLLGHSGREVKTIGDAFLVEFGNALDATRCAVAIQRSMHERNTRNPGSKLELRIGLHVGDVEVQGGDIYGDAVNIVSRVEPMAEPGGVCVSGDVYNQVRNKLDLSLEPLGSPSLKNIEFPVPLYRIELPWMATSLSPRTPWVPRPSEQEALRQAVERALKGEGSAVILLGESGVGKTRLAEETIATAEKMGFRSLSGRAFPGERAMPYSHWVEMVQGFLDDAPAALAQRVVWPVSSELSKLVPKLADEVGAPSPGPTNDPETARTRFYEGVAQFFVDLSRDAPLVLLIDDLQWADASSLSLLEFTIRRASGHRLLLLATCQDPEATGSSQLADMLRYLRKNGALSILEVHRLDPMAVGVMIQRMFNEPERTTQEFQALVHERTGGNPFFVEEVLRSLVEDGSIYRTPDGRWDRKKVEEIGIPKTVRDVVKQRFNRLDQPTQSTLRIASVLGAEFPFELLSEVAGLGEEPLIEQLERLVRAGMLEETKTSKRLLSYAFTDRQLRQVLYEELVAPRRVRYHQRAAAALEKIVGDRKEEFAGELALHFLEGQDIPRARDYSILAGDRLAGIFAFDEAERQYRTALELVEEAADDRVRARALEGLGRVHHSQGRADLTVAEWERAIRLYESIGEPARSGGLCWELANLVRMDSELVPGRPERLEELLENGRRLLESVPPSRQLAVLYEEWAIWLADQGRRAEGRSMVERAIAVAKAIGDRDAEMMMYDELAHTVPLGEGAKVLEFFEAKERYFSRPGKEDWEQVHWARDNLSYASLSILSDVEGARRWAERALEADQKARNRAWESFTLSSRDLRAAIWSGDLERAARSLERARALLNLPPDSHNFALELAAADLALAQDDPVRAAQHLSAIAPDPKHVASYRTWAQRQAAVLLARGERSRAISLLREVIAGESGSSFDVPAEKAIGSVRRRTALLEALLQDSSGMAVSEEMARLSQEIHGIASRMENPYCSGLDQRVSAELAHRQGETAAAIAHWEEAVAFLRRSGNLRELSTTLQRSAEHHRGAGEMEKADSCEKEALEILGRIRRSPAGSSRVPA